MHKAMQTAVKSNPRYLGPISCAGASLAASITFSAFKAISIPAIISKPKHFFRSDFWQPEWMMAGNGGFALYAAKGSFAYWKSLKLDGYKEASKKARNAFFCDLANVAVSFAPSIEWVLKKDKQSASYSFAASPLILPLAFLSTKQLEKAKELQSNQRREEQLSRRIAEGRVPPGVSTNPSPYGELKEKYRENKEGMPKAELKMLLEYVLQDLEAAYAPNQDSQSHHYKNLNGLAQEISRLISEKGISNP